MTSNKQEPKFCPAEADQHVAETFGALVPEDALLCYGKFDRLQQRARGCHQCADHNVCTAASKTMIHRSPEFNQTPNAKETSSMPISGTTVKWFPEGIIHGHHVRDPNTGEEWVIRRVGESNGEEQYINEALTRESSLSWTKEVIGTRESLAKLFTEMGLVCVKPAEESDPTGRTPNDPGAKLDAGKPRLGLVLGGFANALVEVGKVGTFGARKYSDDGWKQVPDAEARYTDALLRHLLTESAGEDVDPDSGLLHAAHTAWNALARLERQMARMRDTE